MQDEPLPGQGEAEEAMGLLLQRVDKTLQEVGERFPLYAEKAQDGGVRWVTTQDGNWCAGYWIGLLWLASRHAEDEAGRQRFAGAARLLLPAMLGQATDHLFAGLNHYYSGFLGFDVTGDTRLRDIGLRGADAMAALYNPTARQIPIGTYVTAPGHATRTSRTPVDRSNFAAVDALHTSMPVLLRAYRETGDERYRDVAVAHARRHMEWHMRADGSTIQMTVFDPSTGAPRERFSTLAASDSGCWSRGLAWHIAGLAHLCETDEAANFLPFLQRSADYYRRRCADDSIPKWDMELDDPAAKRDASAAAIVANGLLRASRHGSLPPDLGRLGAQVLTALLRTCQVKDRQAPDAGAIVHGCYRHPREIAVDNELIWSDFYVASALDAVLSPRP
ncbi:MAG: glycoside hydrolase family 88 protein [Azospirillaceae bacterium]